MSFNIIAGYTGAPHVTAQQARFENQGSYGTGCYVLPVGNQFACNITSAMELSMSDGVVSLQGCTAENTSPIYFNLGSGTAGQKSIDYIVVQYKKNGDGEESIDFDIKPGIPVSGTPAPPSYAAGSIEAGDTLVEYPLWQINIDGLSIASVERVAPVLNTQAELMASIAGIPSLLTGKAPFYTFASGADVNTARAAMSTGDAFIFYGKTAFSQDVLGLATQSSAFGIGFKNSGTSVALLTVCGGKLYYSTYNNTGAGSVYNPLNLTQNV